MGWSTTAPTVKSWEQEQTSYWGQNYFTISTTRSIGRTSGKGIAIKVVLTITDISGRSGGFQANGYVYLYAKVGSADAVEDKSQRMPLGTKTYIFYYTDEAASGVNIVTKAGWSESSGSQTTVSFTAPKTNGNVYANVNGTWKEATMFVNVNGTWKEAQAKINVGGEWK